MSLSFAYQRWQSGALNSTRNLRQKRGEQSPVIWIDGKLTWQSADLAAYVDREDALSLITGVIYTF